MKDKVKEHKPATILLTSMSPGVLYVPILDCGFVAREGKPSNGINFWRIFKTQ